MRIAPPGRKSNSQPGRVNLWGPPHNATCSGSVHTLNTSSRGVSNTRVSTNSCSSFAMMPLVAMVFLLFLHVPQIVIQTVKAFRPEPLIMRQPIGDILERSGRDAAGTPPRLAPARNQTGLLQHFEVPGNGGQAHCKGCGQLGDRGLAIGQSCENSAASGVGERRESGAQVVRGRKH